MILKPEKNIVKSSCDSNKYIIACFCAEWCGTCRDYQSKFHEVSENFIDYNFYWIDIEEDDYLLDDEDIINFPTILIQNKYKTLFYGVINPNIKYLTKIISGIDTMNDHYSSTNAPKLWEKLKK
ncbi:thioredoxin family protein [Candidatus Kinetoplastidibacterium crithidiae]|uniref:Thioredoxin domain-containing protein n=1 Tax=Candidatus Kinetoplastidibacterium crithidiae TCC036E TaxID=1208918 RepID=M1M6W1_9PROT|nr:thioredoxin family protein [Candidatus Kinetoplastibacterium crithidii]AFZ82523.1 thioredoxin domain-containing protein [Candidatus Kinetoplastibacterium crithidii (ex Angomonas deanei ATCC 30255)]AGF47815.1 thioredoxin domain-containing protein [Candidatus Kinetoplastibacterium crithidii TCC036E]